MRKSTVIFTLSSALLPVIAAGLADVLPGPQSQADALPALSAAHIVLSDDAVPAVAPGKTAPHTQKPAVQHANQLDPKKHVDKVAMLISSNEGKLTTIDWNDNGHGVSVGMFQANQQVGELPEMLQNLCNDPHGRCTMNSIFGPSLTSTIQKNPDVVEHLNFKPSNSLGSKLRKLVWMKDFQTLQVKMPRQKVLKAANAANRHGFKSTAGVAVYADLTNQWGPGGAARWARYADRYQSEGAKIKAVVQAVNSCSRYGSRYKQDLKKAECYGLTVNDAFHPQS